jgi:hypothetical protein
VSNDIELVIGDVDTELAASPSFNPGVIEGVVVEAEDGFDVGVLAVAWCDTEPALVSAGCDIIVNEADTIGWRERRGLEVARLWRTRGRQDAMKEVGVPESIWSVYGSERVVARMFGE